MLYRGIIFFSIYEEDYVRVAAGQLNWAIDQWIATFKLVAPAKMWICLRFEADLYATRVETQGVPASSSYYGSPDEYKAYWNHVQDRFAASGVTNAVWVVDWSANGGATAEYHPLLAALWPGDDRVV